MERKSFIFYKEYKEAINNIEDKKIKLEIYEAIVNYALYNIEPINVSNVTKAFFKAIKEKLGKQAELYNRYEIRTSNKYKKWKDEVLKRDDYKCKLCGSKENIVVHHIKSFSKYPELRLEVSNGVVLCQKCHRKVHENEKR